MRDLSVYVLRRFVFLVPTFIGAMALVFGIMHLTGDPIAVMMLGDPYLTPQTLTNMQAYYGLDKPIYYQFLMWLWHLINFDFGTSIISGRSVSEMILAWAWITIRIQLAAISLCLTIAIPVGVYAALHQYSKGDAIVTSLTFLGQSLPYFWWMLMMLFLFSYNLGIFPAFGALSIGDPLWGRPLLDELWHMTLPILSLALLYLPPYVRLVRSGMLEVLREDYVTAARSLGLPNRTVVFKHALRNAILPVVTYLGIFIGRIIVAAPVTETIFSLPGVGFLYIQALRRFDFPLIMGITAVTSIMVLASNLIVDILYSYIDPRISLK